MSAYVCVVCGGEAETRGAVNHSDADDTGPGCRAWAAWDALSDLAEGRAGPDGACDVVLAELADHLARTLDAFMIRRADERAS